MTPKKRLQLGFSQHYSNASFNAAARRKKGLKVLAILEDSCGELDALCALDIGCSTGFMTSLYATRFKYVLGTDIDEPAVQYAARENRSTVNLAWSVHDSQQMGFRDESFDVITCSHIYEHVPDARRLMTEIYRLLKPGGICFFSAGNRLSLIEPHYKIPLLSVMPKWMAHRYLKLLGKGNFYYETHLGLGGLRKLVSEFEIIDYTVKVVRDPIKFHAEDMIESGSVRQKAILAFLKAFYWLCPTYLWVLRKPDTEKQRLLNVLE